MGIPIRIIYAIGKDLPQAFARGLNSQPIKGMRIPQSIVLFWIPWSIGFEPTEGKMMGDILQLTATPFLQYTLGN